jgi:hypothetical protein
VGAAQQGVHILVQRVPLHLREEGEAKLVRHLGAIVGKTTGTLLIVCLFYSCRDASHAEICFYDTVHSHSSWPRSGDCGGSRIRTRDSCFLCLVSPSCFNQLSHHIPRLHFYRRYTDHFVQCTIPYRYI